MGVLNCPLASAEMKTVGIAQGKDWVAVASETSAVINVEEIAEQFYLDKILAREWVCRVLSVGDSMQTVEWAVLAAPS